VLSAQWLNSLKIAIIEEEYETLAKLCDNIPQPDNIDDIKEAHTLIKDAIVVLQNEQKSFQTTMAKIKLNSAFLTQEKKKSRLSTLS